MLRTMVIAIAPNATVSAAKPSRIRADSVRIPGPYTVARRSTASQEPHPRAVYNDGPEGDPMARIRLTCLALLFVSVTGAVAMAETSIAVLGLEDIDKSGTP